MTRDISHVNWAVISKVNVHRWLEESFINGSTWWVKEALLSRGLVRASRLTLGSSKIKLLTISRLWRYCGPSNYRFNFILYWYAPWVFFEVVNVLSCSPFMFENTENKQLDWIIRHSHLAPALFHSLVPWWRPRRIRPQITRLSQLENSGMGTWPIYKNSIIPDWFENGMI